MHLNLNDIAKLLYYCVALAEDWCTYSLALFMQTWSFMHKDRLAVWRPRRSGMLLVYFKLSAGSFALVLIHFDFKTLSISVLLRKFFISNNITHMSWCETLLYTKK